VSAVQHGLESPGQGGVAAAAGVVDRDFEGAALLDEDG